MSQQFFMRLKEKGYANGTIQAYKSVLSHFKGDEIDSKSIERFQKKLMTFKDTTRFSYLIRLKKYLEYTNPKLAKQVIIPDVPQRLPKDIPNQTEFKQILQKPNVFTFKGLRDRALLELFYSTGIRKAELINLRIDDIDHGKLLVRINQGKMKKDRILPISKKSHRWIKRYIEKVRPLLKPRTNHLFISMYGDQLSDSVPHKIIKSYAEYSCHSYRHAYATHLIQNGMNVASLQRLLGHSRLTSTQIYTQVTLNELKASYAKYHQRDKWEKS